MERSMQWSILLHRVKLLFAKFAELVSIAGRAVQLFSYAAILLSIFPSRPIFAQGILSSKTDFGASSAAVSIANWLPVQSTPCCGFEGYSLCGLFGLSNRDRLHSKSLERTRQCDSYKSWVFGSERNAGSMG
jgi:hypothetical protein